MRAIKNWLNFNTTVCKVVYRGTNRNLCYKLGVLQSEIMLENKDMSVLVGCKMSVSHRSNKAVTTANALCQSIFTSDKEEFVTLHKK